MTAIDRNFDDLFERFNARIYDTIKGDWRLHLLRQDLSPIIANNTLSIWDAGCGQAQISLWLAQQGHSLTLCDISEKMLASAQEQFTAAKLTAEFYHQSAQSLALQLPEFDVVLFHAVLEWLADPITSLLTLLKNVRLGGYLSLLFYNRNAMVYHNVLRGGWRLTPILNDDYIGKGHKLSPPNPQFPHELISLLRGHGFNVIQHTGIRVFHDYLSEQAKINSSSDELFELEQRYCRLPTYRDMGRYVHLLLQRTDNQ